MMEQLKPTGANKSELLGYFTFNNSTCTWIMMELHNLQHQKKQTVGILLLSTILLVPWDNDGTAQPAAPESKLLGYFTFNTSTCTWDNDGTY
jgi:hypothetical protein